MQVKLHMQSYSIFSFQFALSRCRFVHLRYRIDYDDITDPTTLPKTQIGDTIEFVPLVQSRPKPIFCDQCKDKTTEATCFCIETQSKLCTEHREVSLYS